MSIVAGLHFSRLGTLTESAQAVVGAESLSVRNGQLWVGYTLNASGNSERLGKVNLDGAIDVASVQVADRDIDALAWNGGEWRGVDVNAPTSGQSAFFGGVGPDFVTLRIYSNSLAQINDLDYDAGQLWGMAYASGATGGKLIRIDQADGTFLESAIFSTSGVFSNLAAIPEPARLGLVAAACALLIRRGRQSILKLI
jgi:hypothetical protein